MWRRLCFTGVWKAEFARDYFRTKPGVDSSDDVVSKVEELCKDEKELFGFEVYDEAVGVFHIRHAFEQFDPGLRNTELPRGPLYVTTLRTGLHLIVCRRDRMEAVCLLGETCMRCQTNETADELESYNFYPLYPIWYYAICSDSPLLQEASRSSRTVLGMGVAEPVARKYRYTRPDTRKLLYRPTFDPEATASAGMNLISKYQQLECKACTTERVGRRVPNVWLKPDAKTLTDFIEQTPIVLRYKQVELRFSTYMIVCVTDAMPLIPVKKTDYDEMFDMLKASASD